MPETSTTTVPHSTHPASSTLYLRLLGIASIVLGVACAAAQVLAIIRMDQSADVWQWAAAGCFLLSGLAVGSLLIGISTVMQMLARHAVDLKQIESVQQELARTMQQINEAVTTSRHAETQEGAWPGEWKDSMSEIMRGLTELREAALLTDAQRQERLSRKDVEEVDAARAQIRYLVSEGNYREAREAANAIAEKRPDDPRATELVNFVEAARSQRESSEVAKTSREIKDLLSMSAWPQARSKVQSLLEQHPDSAAARQLMVQIEREYHQAMEEQRRRMYAEVQRFVTRKRWEEALAAARTFVERFEGSDDAEAVRMQIPTLEMNAEIELRQQLEAQIMDLARHGRYIEAVSLARRVIEQYPESPQADALRNQIDRLEELATNPDAPPARIRVDESNSRSV